MLALDIDFGLESYASAKEDWHAWVATPQDPDVTQNKPSLAHIIDVCEKSFNSTTAAMRCRN